MGRPGGGCRSAPHEGSPVSAFGPFLLPLPLIAVLRGITPEEVPDVAGVLVDVLLHEDLDVRARLDGNDPRLDTDRFGSSIQLGAELLAIPLSRNITSRDMDDVADAIRKVAAASQRMEAPR